MSFSNQNPTNHSLANLNFNNLQSQTTNHLTQFSNQIITDNHSQSLVGQNLIDWLWTKSTSLLLYPQTIEAAWLMATIISGSAAAGRIIVLMTDQRNRVNDYLQNGLTMNYFLDYGNSAALEKALSMDSLIIIDRPNPPQVRNMKNTISQRRSSDGLATRPAHLLILATLEPGLVKLERNLDWFTPLDQKNQIGYLALILTDEGPTLRYSKLETKMTPEQQVFYWHKRLNEIRQGSKVDHELTRPSRTAVHIKNNYIKSSMVGNFVYPANYQVILDEDKNHSEPVPPNFSNRGLPLAEMLSGPPDRDISQNGWLTSEIISQLDKYSAKFQQLLTVISSHPEEKIVVFTHYRARSGQDLLATLFTYLNFNFVIINTDDKGNELDEKLRSFNDQSPLAPNVLLTTIVPYLNLFNVNQLHLIERGNQDDYLAFLSKIYRKSNYTKMIANFTVYYHIAQLQSKINSNHQPIQNNLGSNKFITTDESIAADEAMYQKLMTKINQWRQIYIKLLNRSNLVSGTSSEKNKLLVYDLTSSSIMQTRQPVKVTPTLNFTPSSILPKTGTLVSTTDLSSNQRLRSGDIVSVNSNLTGDGQLAINNFSLLNYPATS